MVDPAELSSRALYGRTVFTTIAIIGGEPFLWPKHWRRLTSAASRLSIDLEPFPESLVRSKLDAQIEQRSLIRGRARVTLGDETPSKIWSSISAPATSLSVATASVHSDADDPEVTISPYPVNSRSPLAGLKSGNYLEAVLSIEWGQRRGFSEVIRLNEQGHVTGGSMANVFWLSSSRLYTPELACGCLAGTTREYVLDNLSVVETTVGVQELERADAIFLTSAGLCIRQVTRLDDRRFDIVEHPILDLWPKALKHGEPKVR